MKNYTFPELLEAKPTHRAMYIWLDGQQPTCKLRSKTKVLDAGQQPPIWGFDGSSTEQATGESSDCVLVPVFTCKDTITGGDNLISLSLNTTIPIPHLHLIYRFIILLVITS